MLDKSKLIKVSDCLWEIPQKYRPDMRVPARIYASEKMLKDILSDRSLEQLVNVSTLPGIQKCALAMPDTHEGYGFPIGGVAAMNYPDGTISPGGIGYDINCGVRLMKSNLDFESVRKYLEKTADVIYSEIPSGVGKSGKIKLDSKGLDAVLRDGARWAVKAGYGNQEDLKHIESEGSLSEADPNNVSDHAKQRGKNQLGTLGAGNHFLEVGKVDKVYDEKNAAKLGLKFNQITVLIHSGSRGLGHQIATDYIRVMNGAMPNYKIRVPDRELVCVPFSSKEGQNYFSAMSAAANFAWANRQFLGWNIRKVFDRIFGADGKLDLVYDVAHNIAKIERHTLENQTFDPSSVFSNEKIKFRIVSLIVHRKGATRAFPNQPVIIPGSMGTASYIMIGTEKAMKESFGSICHGAGRAMSRHEAARMTNVQKLKADLEKQEVLIRTGFIRGLAEEAPLAYKNINEVIDVVCQAGLAEKVVRLKPLVVIKG